MNWLQTVSSWLTGGAHPYHTLYQCMMGDTLWVAITVCLDLAVAIGYAIIALHWWRNQRLLPPSPSRSALGAIRNIFVFCGICGYVFIPIKMFWPAWRLYDIFLAVLAFYTWRYALGARDLKVVYTAIGRTNQLAEDLARTREEARKKSFFFHAVSHDLRTPLNSLMLNAHVAELHATTGDIAGVRDALAAVQNSGRRTAELLDDLLEYARLKSSEEPLHATDISLDYLIRDVLDAHSAMAAEKSLVLTGNTNLRLALRTDRLKLERILNNLVSNAIKFTSEGSVTIDGSQSDGIVEISVTDTGVGISPDDRPRLFEEFFQAKNHERNPKKGFGLGLAISRRLARQLGGDIRLDSAREYGCRFIVALPDGSNEPLPQAQSAQPAFQPVPVAK